MTADGRQQEDAEPEARTAESATEPDADAHLEDVETGAGCTEIWEHLAEQRGE